MDLILGRFAESYLPAAGQDDLEAYALMLQENDPDVYDWIIGAADAPAPFAALIARIQVSCNVA